MSDIRSSCKITPKTYLLPKPAPLHQGSSRASSRASQGPRDHSRPQHHQPPRPQAAIHKIRAPQKTRTRRHPHTPLTRERPSYSLLSPSHATSKHSSAEAMRCLAGSQLEAKRGFSFPAAQPHSGTSCLYTTAIYSCWRAPRRNPTAEPQRFQKKKKKKTKKGKKKEEPKNKFKRISKIIITRK